MGAKWYEPSRYSAEIRILDVTRETDKMLIHKSIYFGEVRTEKAGKFPTWQEAKEHLVTKYSAAVNRANDDLSKALALNEPHD